MISAEIKIITHGSLSCNNNTWPV